MKILLAFMVCVLALGGFSAACHAMSPEECSLSFSVQGDTCDPETQQSSDHAQKHDKSGKGLCLDCAHSCVSSVLLSGGAVWFPDLMPDHYDVEPVHYSPQAQFFSLLRPPRTLA